MKAQKKVEGSKGETKFEEIMDFQKWTKKINIKILEKWWISGSSITDTHTNTTTHHIRKTAKSQRQKKKNIKSIIFISPLKEQQYQRNNNNKEKYHL